MNCIFRNRLFSIKRRICVICRHKHDFWKDNKSIDVEVLLDRKNLKFSFGKLTRFADGSCIASIGRTVVNTTAVSKAKLGQASFVPLMVDYRQKANAASLVPTNFLRRELGPSEKEVLTSRTIDRSVRPMFPRGFADETQLCCNVMELDGLYDPDVISINSASAALSLSDIPWNGPVAAVRVGFIDDEPIIFPTIKEMRQSSLNLVVTASSQHRIVMLESSAENLPDHDFQRALIAGIEAAQAIIEKISELQRNYGKEKKQIDPSVFPSTEILDSAKLVLEAKYRDVLTNFSLHKVSRGQEMDILRQEAVEKLKENFPDADPTKIYEAVNTVGKEVFRKLVLETGIRCDGRSLTEVRNISCEVDIHKTLHGSALFQRGQTQVGCTVAFDSLVTKLRSDPVSVLIGGMKEKNFMLHYEFPPYATNEIGRVGAYGRREIGHGNLAERSLRPVMPADYGFTTRLTAEVYESNGSSSMASVCAGSLALMDAGVPISCPVAGVAMGLMTSSSPDNPECIEEYKILTDILGLEDYMGDMDFKIAGSRDGITAAQLDIKVPGGISMDIVSEALKQASDARCKILEIMNATIPEVRSKKKKNAPITEKLEVPIHKLSKFFGLDGTNLKKIMAETGVQLTHVENGVFSVFAPNATAMADANEIIQQLITDEGIPHLEFGAIYTAKIVEIRDFGVMVTLYPTMKPALLPNSQLDQRKIRHPSALGLEVGQELKVKYFGRDPANGSMRLSRKVIQNLPSSLVKDFIGSQQESSKSSL